MKTDILEEFPRRIDGSYVKIKWNPLRRSSELQPLRFAYQNPFLRNLLINSAWKIDKIRVGSDISTAFFDLVDLMESAETYEFSFGNFFFSF